MSTTKLKRLYAERDQLLREMPSFEKLLYGSFLERYSTCANPDCECHSGQRHGPHYCLVVNIEGKQQQRYVSKACVEAVLAGVEEAQKLRQLLTDLTLLNLAIIKEESRL